MEALCEPLTPTDAFYVRNHFDVPELEAASWRLRVEGAVARPRTLSLEALRAFPRREVTLTLECAGNGRRTMTPTPPGTPWSFGAASTGTFTGVPLADVLDAAGVDPAAREIAFYGADEGEVAPGRREPFGRSLPVADAREPDVILAWSLNGAPIPAEHGHPVRLVVPGWYAMASVKWLVRIEARREPFGGYYQRDRYVYVGEEGTPDGTPVTRMRPRAVIGRPEDGVRLRPGPTEIAGTAWSGRAGIRRVEVSADGGASWREAELGEPLSPHAAAPWRLPWTPARPGRYEILARATDERGDIQPLRSRWNRYGYGNNVVQRIEVEVQEERGGSRP